jgi:hypothetical protein
MPSFRVTGSVLCTLVFKDRVKSSVNAKVSKHNLKDLFQTLPFTYGLSEVFTQRIEIQAKAHYLGMSWAKFQTRGVYIVYACIQKPSQVVRKRTFFPSLIGRLFHTHCPSHPICLKHFLCKLNILLKPIILACRRPNLRPTGLILCTLECISRIKS